MIKRIIYTLYEEVEADTDEEAFDKSTFDEMQKMNDSFFYGVQIFMKNYKIKLK